MRKEEHSSPASLLIMKYNINLLFVACTAREHTFTRHKVYTTGGSAQQERCRQASNFRNKVLTGNADWN